MKITFLVLPILLSTQAIGSEYYHYIPENIQLVTSDPTQPSDLHLLSNNVQVGSNYCYSWNMGNMLKDVGNNSFGWATGFYPPTSNQIQSLSTDSGFQSYGYEQGIYIATPNRSVDGALDIQCGKYYGATNSFFPWSLGSNATLRHGVLFKMPQAYHSNLGDKKYYVTMYLRISEKNVEWKNSYAPEKGYWLQVKIVDGRGSVIFPNGQGYHIMPDLYTNHFIIDIEKSNKSNLITSNGESMQTAPWNDYKYFDYTINRSQISQITSLINGVLPISSRLTTNPNDLMVFAVGTSPEVHVIGTEQAILGATIKNQYLRTEY